MNLFTTIQEKGMALSLPPKDSPIRDHFDVAHLAEMVTASKFVTYAEAKASAKALIKSSKGAVSGATYIVLAADGALKLITFGPKLGKKILWTFGKVH
jgi:hypothetical protein|tara:strand:+ start:1024 stop:1317 length:294 start_codon:yes stop_codon:yes gene_type:complete